MVCLSIYWYQFDIRATVICQLLDKNCCPNDTIDNHLIMLRYSLPINVYNQSGVPCQSWLERQSSKWEVPVVGSSPTVGKNFLFCNSPFLHVSHSLTVTINENIPTQSVASPRTPHLSMIYVHCDLDLWPLTSKINRVHPLIMVDMSAKFDKEICNGLVSIVFTRFSHGRKDARTEPQKRYYIPTATRCAGIMKCDIHLANTGSKISTRPVAFATIFTTGRSKFGPAIAQMASTT